MKTKDAMLASVAALVLLLTACSSDGPGSPELTGAAVESTGEAVPEESAPEEAVPEESAPETGAVVPVGGMFSASTLFGDFDITYNGLADLGTADGGVAGEVTCLGIMISITMTALDDGFDEGGFAVVAPEVLDTSGTDIAAVQRLGCERPYLDTGWEDAGSLDLSRERIGTTYDQVMMTTVAVSVGAVADAKTIVLQRLPGAPALEFAITESF